MPTNGDGGILALAGFLYQLLGTVDLAAHAFDVDPVRSPDKIDDLIVGLTRTSRIIKRIGHESFGQDAEFRMESLIPTEPDCTALIQFKYSADPQNHLINAGHLREILKAFERSVELAQKAGQKVLMCILITNRPFTKIGGGAQQDWEDARKKASDYELQLVENYPFSEHSKALSRFAYDYGLTDSEIEQGIREFIGSLLIDTVTSPGPLIDKKAFVKFIVGDSDARKLVINDARSIWKDKLNNLNDGRLGVGLTGTLEPIPREDLASLTELCSRNALIVLHGMGGCGKTVALWHWLYATEVASSMKGAGELSDNWIVNEVCEWAGLNPLYHARRRDSIEVAVNRLLQANPNVQPILHLGVDGVDEVSPISKPVIDTVKWFRDEDKRSKERREPPRAVLIVTCRDIEYFKRNLLFSDWSGFNLVATPSNLKLDIFKESELKSALRSSMLAPEVIARIEDAIQPYSDGVVSSPIPVYQTSSAPDPSIIQALKHPVVWCSFIRLDLENQMGVLDTDKKSLNCLAENVIDRFYTKAKQRPACHDLPDGSMEYALHEIACHSTKSPDKWYQLQDDWKQPAINGGELSRPDAQRIYDEALSQGLITQQPGHPIRWRWAHDWIAGYLANMEDRS